MKLPKLEAMEHPHSDKAHVVRQMRRYLMRERQCGRNPRSQVHYRELVRTYLTAKRQLFSTDSQPSGVGK